MSIVRRILFFVTLSVTATSAVAQESSMSDRIHYRIGWDNPASQLYAIRVTASTDGSPVQFHLPAWRPGRYIVQNYASNVQNVRATDGNGNALATTWTDLDTWRVEPTGPGQVTLAYEYYAHTYDAGSSTLKPDLAYFNPVNLFPWVDGRIGQPVELVLDAPADWQVATQLVRAEAREGAPHVFTAPDYHDFVDSPTIASPTLDIWEFEADGATFRMAFQGKVDLGERTQDEVVDDVRAITREFTAMMGGAPFDEYWHLYQMVPFQIGHAVEHENSASYVLSDIAFKAFYQTWLSVTAHEFFHAWNVKRIRPAALWPYDYSAPQLTRLHWVTEGVTNYYDKIMLARAGVVPFDELLHMLGGVVRGLQGSPGRHVTSASLSSLTSWFSGYGDGNPNQSVNFYTKGSALGLLLDMRIRDLTDGEKSLDDVMRTLQSEYYEQDLGYPEDGFQTAVEQVAGASFDEFFQKYVHGTEELPYNEFLTVVGLEAIEVVRDDRTAATLGVTLAREGDAIRVSNVVPESPALAGGVMIDDRLVSIAGAEVTGPSLEAILVSHAPGDEVALVVTRDGEQIDTTVTLGGGGNLRWEIRSVEAPTERQLRQRESWLASLVE